MKIKPILIATAVLFVATAAFPHDYWIEPEKFFPAIGVSVPVRLFVGEELISREERVLQKEKTVRFQMFSQDATEDLMAAGNDGQSPIAQVVFKSPGSYLIAMERNQSYIKLDAQKFTDYLREEGLNDIIEQRMKSGESQTEGREQYSRYLKSLVQVGNRRDDTYKREMGFRLEIIPINNPYPLKIGDSLLVRVLFEGKPLAGAKIEALCRYENEGRGRFVTMTSSSGTALFKIEKSGVWAVRLVHMRRCSNCKDADWESLWASYSFGVR
jgi:uncharacterized GH25 family protein